MIKSVTAAGFALLGLIPATQALAQTLPAEIVLLQNGTARLTGDLAKTIDDALKACDKCDANAKRELQFAQKAVAALRTSVNDLKTHTDGKYRDLVKACK